MAKIRLRLSKTKQKSDNAFGKKRTMDFTRLKHVKSDGYVNFGKMLDIASGNKGGNHQYISISNNRKTRQTGIVILTINFHHLNYNIIFFNFTDDTTSFDMPKTKNAIIRYQALDKCLRNPGKNYSITDLVNECNTALKDIDSSSTGVKKRQVYDDLKFMRDSKGYDAPITNFKNGRVVYYHYEDRNFTINNQPLNELEAQQLKESLITLSRFSGLPQFEWVEDMKLRLDQFFKFESQEHIIEFDSNPYLQGREHIGNLYASISNHKVLEVTYHSFKYESSQEVIIHPYFLKEYNNRWFLFGLKDQSDFIISLALDRILDVKERNIDFMQNTQVDFDEYFEDVIGVSVNANEVVQKIILKVDSDLWPYIQTKPLHGSQKIVEQGNDFSIISIEVKRNYELESLLLSFGDKIEILEPTDLRSDLLKRIERLKEKHK